MKSRSGAAGASSQVAQSIDAVRRRARHRLIGATILVLLGVVGFSLLFDAQPRPTVSSIPIEIPERDQVKPGAASVAPTATSGSSSLDDREEIVSEPSGGQPAGAAADTPKETQDPAAEKNAAKPIAAKEPVKEAVVAASKPAAQVEAKDKPVATPAPAVTRNDPAQTAASQAKPDAGDARFVVQVGAFADQSSVSSVRSKLERAGLKTYAQTVDTPDGKRTRVRLGPFTSQAEADKAAAKAKALGLPTRILTL